MTPSSHAEALIQQSEGYYSKSYLCPAGKWTIGWGHTRGVKPGDVCSKELALIYLQEDLQEAANAVNRLVKIPLNQNQFDALCSLVFNIGSEQFEDSTLLRKLNKKDYLGAAKEFPRWNKGRVKGKLVVLNGLVTRRKAEQNLFLSED